MKRPKAVWFVTLAAALAVWPAAALAQANVPGFVPTRSEEAAESANVEPEDAVVQHDLSGPRLGFTVTPDGEMTSQFGWHGEHQAAPGRRGPWFIVENVILVSGVEKNRFVPNGTLVFGFRTADGFEFGLGPGIALGGPLGARTSIVFAAGRSFAVGGIRVPVNLALATDQYGQRLTFVTGWAIRDRPTP